MNTKSSQNVSYNTHETREVTSATPEQWDGWLADSPGGGHALQSHAWGDLKREQGWHPVRMVLEKGGVVAGAGQFLLRSTLPAVPGKLMYASKGPWLDWSDEQAVRSFFETVVKIARREGAHTLKIEPEVHGERSEVRELLGEIGFKKARYDLNFDTTILVDLSPSEDDLMARMGGKSTRYNVRLASRKSVEVYQPPDFDWAREIFLDWLEDTAERKEGFTNRRPRGYFREMMRDMYEAGQGHFFFAAHDGEPLSGVYLLTFGGKCWYMHGASSRYKRNLKPTYLLQWEVMRWAKSHGITYYDMVGAPKREHRTEDNPYYGVYKFKKGFGGEVVEFLGCMDLPVEPWRAATWRRLEPFHYRAYAKAKNNIFY